jgi:hypothetical protein
LLTDSTGVLSFHLCIYCIVSRRPSISDLMHCSALYLVEYSIFIYFLFNSLVKIGVNLLSPPPILPELICCSNSPDTLMQQL